MMVVAQSGRLQLLPSPGHRGTRASSGMTCSLLPPSLLARPEISHVGLREDPVSLEMCLASASVTAAAWVRHQEEPRGPEALNAPESGSRKGLSARVCRLASCGRLPVFPVPAPALALGAMDAA